MKKAKGMNALLVEIMIAVLFFALCATVILEIFASARNICDESGIKSDAMLKIQDVAERMYVSDDIPEMLASDGFVENEGVWMLECEGYEVTVVLNDEAAEYGIIRSADITAETEDGQIAQIPCVRYMSGEVK